MTACTRYGLWRLLSSAHFIGDESPSSAICVARAALLPSSQSDDASASERCWLRRAVVAQTLALAAQVRIEGAKKK